MPTSNGTDGTTGTTRTTGTTESSAESVVPTSVALLSITLLLMLALWL